jgi:hypothetical protein
LHNGTQHNEAQQNVTQHNGLNLAFSMNDNQHNGTQHNEILPNIALYIVIWIFVFRSVDATFCKLDSFLAKNKNVF